MHQGHSDHHRFQALKIQGFYERSVRLNESEYILIELQEC